MTWDDVLDRMLVEILTDQPRLQSYWAQQLAFSPVLVHALRLRIRAGRIPPESASSVAQIVRLGLSGLAALPETPATDPVAMTLLARRQARALQWGRRWCLRRILDRLGEPSDEPAGVVPSRMVRPYPLLGWRPGNRHGEE